MSWICSKIDQSKATPNPDTLFLFLARAMKNRYFIVPVLALICLILGAIEFYGFPVGGVEFSPDSFTQRQFQYWRSPFSRIIRSKRFLTTIVSECDSLVALNLIPKSDSTKQRWDLVSESLQTSDVLSSDFDARFLTQYLDYSTDQWNRNNVEKAEILWPEIALLVREGLYLQLPTLFHFATNSPEELSNEEFEEQLNKQLAAAWFQAANVTVARARSADDSLSVAKPGTATDAKRFLNKAIEFDPSYKDAMLLEMPSPKSSSP